MPRPPSFGILSETSGGGIAVEQDPAPQAQAHPHPRPERPQHGGRREGPHAEARPLRIQRASALGASS